MTERWTAGWDELVSEVLDPDLCSGCGGCLIACPKNALVLDPITGHPTLIADAWMHGDDRHCAHADRGCTLCARVCPRFRLSDADLDDLSYWDGDPIGPHRRIVLARATDSHIAGVGQDGGVASAILIYALEHDYIDAGLVSGFDADQRTEPAIARTRADVLACAGSRYTYSANTLALAEADPAKDARIGIVSVGCQISVPAIAAVRGARKLSRRFALTVGLLCSKTFTDGLFGEMLDSRYGIARSAISKINIKGRLQVWHTGGYLEVPLKECREFTRRGCATCPDFTARHADVSLGGIGTRVDTTLVVVRTDLGLEIMQRMERDGWIEVVDAATADPAAIEIVRKMAASQQRRWPTTVHPATSRQG